MDRYDLQVLAEQRIIEATILLDAGAGPGAYYLGGYAVECGLKACIASKVREYQFPDKRIVDDSYTHDLVKLLSPAGLTRQHREEEKGDSEFRARWHVVKDWSANSRYETRSMEKAEALIEAINDPRHGVMRWIRQNW